jgi:hypothetical protein
MLSKELEYRSPRCILCLRGNRILKVEEQCIGARPQRFVQFFLAVARDEEQ